MRISRRILPSFVFGFALLGAVAAAPAGEATVALFVGEVAITRAGTPVPVAAAAAVREGDVIRVGSLAFLELALAGGGSRVRISGPALFRFSRDTVAKKMREGAARYGLYARFSKETVRYMPVTVVAAVRKEIDPESPGGAGGPDEEAVRAGFEKAIASFQAGDLEAAGKGFAWLKAQNGLSREALLLITFYEAEILFARGGYEAALPLYRDLAATLAGRFRHREEAHARAVLCADLAGNAALVKQLAQEYFSEYGEQGKFREDIRQITAGE